MVANCIAGFLFTKMYVRLLRWSAYWREEDVRRISMIVTLMTVL